MPLCDNRVDTTALAGKDHYGRNQTIHDESATPRPRKVWEIRQSHPTAARFRRSPQTAYGGHGHPSFPPFQGVGFDVASAAGRPKTAPCDWRPPQVSVGRRLHRTPWWMRSVSTTRCTPMASGMLHVRCAAIANAPLPRRGKAVHSSAGDSSEDHQAWVRAFGDGADARQNGRIPPRVFVEEHRVRSARQRRFRHSSFISTNSPRERSSRATLPPAIGTRTRALPSRSARAKSVRCARPRRCPSSTAGMDSAS